MPDSEINNDFKDFLQKGLAQDIFMSQVHYFIYRTLGENALAVNQMKMNNERKQLIYLQETSMDMALISLARIFDRHSRNKKYKVRCITTLIEECKQIPGRFPLNLEHHPDLEKLSSLTNVIVPETLDTKDQLILFYSDVLNSESVQNAVQSLKTVRDKFIVHNEHSPDIEHLASFWDDCFFLQDIAKLYLSTVGMIFIGIHYSFSKEIGPNKVDFNILFQFRWVVDLLEKVLGKGKVKIWWE